jgi:phage gp29-like protein
MGSKTKKAFAAWGPQQKLDTPEGRKEETIENDNSGAGHFATRQRANEFVRLMRTLPDPDPVLRKMGRGITALQELLTDSHLESVWSIRCSATSGAEWFCSAGGDGNGAKEKEAAEVFGEELNNIDIPRVIEEMMDAVAFGYSPLEVIWLPDGGRWAVGDIVGKPPQWFEFDQDNKLVFKTGVIGTEELPDNRFLIARHRPSYANPYGVKVFSKCFWPVTFKKSGFRWWTVFVEKYGGAFLYGKYPSNAGAEYKQELLDALEKMIADAVAIAPAEAEITIESLANKGSVSTVHSGYIEACNKEISKAVLGQTLTTDIGSVGSYAAAQAHNMVRQDLAAADRRRISSCFNRLAAVWTFYNYGAGVDPPVFNFVKDEDLQSDRADRDVKLHAIGVRPKKSYIEREYEIPEEDFDIAEAASPEPQAGTHARRFTSCPCGCGGDILKHDFFMNFRPSLFASKAEKQQARDYRLMNQFAKQMLEAGQSEVDKAVEYYADALGEVKDYKQAEAALLKAYKKRSLDEFAHTIDEIRFAAQGIGGSHA